MRPTYETSAHLASEAEVIAQVERRLGCHAKKCPQQYRVDCVFLHHGTAYCFAEVKCRVERHEPYMISLNKWIALAQLAGFARCDSLIVVQWPDFPLLYVDVLPHNRLPYAGWGGRKDRGDWQDMEPMALVPLSRFKPLDD